MQTVQPIDFRRARKENFSTCWDFAFEIMNEPLYFSVSSESVNNPNCRTCLPCACVGNFPISLVSLAMLSEIYHGLGKVSVNNRLNFATLFIITISLRPAQNTVTQPCWKRVSPARGWRRVFTGLLAFGPPWKIEIVFSQVFGLLLMVTMVTVTITINLFDFEVKFWNTVSQIFRWRRNVRLSAMTALLVDSSLFSLKSGLEIFTTYVC